jgi:hypothetical protein
MIVVLLAACADADNSQRISGTIQDLLVEEDLLVSLMIRDASGNVASFEIAEPRQLNVGAAHLEWHKQHGEPVSLLLAPRDGRLLVTSIDDCPC